MRFKRAQAAMEFLMTYGWAILVVLIVIAALAYLGVLNPQALVPEKCTITPLNCLGATTTSDGNIVFTITNSLGGNIRIKAINFTTASGEIFNSGASTMSYTVDGAGLPCSSIEVNGGTPSSCDSSDGLLLSPGDQAKITTDNNPIATGLEGTKARMKVKITYEDTLSGLTKYADGEIVVRVNG